MKFLAYTVAICGFILPWLLFIALCVYFYVAGA